MSKRARIELEHRCGAVVTVPAADGVPQEVPCHSCGEAVSLHPARVTETGGLAGCVACDHPELFRKKSFPPALGLGIVVLAAVFAPWTHYISLAVGALLDGVLYVIMPEVVCCYICNAHHHDFEPEPKHPRFDREIDERLRYGEKAVMGKPMREGGTAGAPEPEH